MRLKLLRKLGTGYAFSNVQYCLVRRNYRAISHLDDTRLAFGVRSPSSTSFLVVKALGHPFLTMNLLICQHLTLSGTYLRWLNLDGLSHIFGVWLSFFALSTLNILFISKLVLLTANWVLVVMNSSDAKLVSYFPFAWSLNHVGLFVIGLFPLLRQSLSDERCSLHLLIGEMHGRIFLAWLGDAFLVLHSRLLGIFLVDFNILIYVRLLTLYLLFLLVRFLFWQVWVIALIRHHRSCGWRLVLAARVHVMNVVGTTQLVEVHVAVLYYGAIWCIRGIFVLGGLIRITCVADTHLQIGANLGIWVPLILEQIVIVAGRGVIVATGALILFTKSEFTALVGGLTIETLRSLPFHGWVFARKLNGLLLSESYFGLVLRFHQDIVPLHQINCHKVTSRLIFVLLNIEHYLVLQIVILLHFPNRLPPFLLAWVIVEIYIWALWDRPIIGARILVVLKLLVDIKIIIAVLITFDGVGWAPVTRWFSFILEFVPQDPGMLEYLDHVQTIQWALLQHTLYQVNELIWSPLEKAV